MNIKNLKILLKHSENWYNSPDVLKIREEIECNGHKNLKRLGFVKIPINREDPSNWCERRMDPNKNYGSQAKVWKKGRIVVKINPLLVEENPPKDRCPTIFIETGENKYLIQPLVNVSKFKTNKLIKKMEGTRYTDSHCWNWGFWKNLPVWFDW
jgi:hypothetical protein